MPSLTNMVITLGVAKINIYGILLFICHKIVEIFGAKLNLGRFMLLYFNLQEFLHIFWPPSGY